MKRFASLFAAVGVSLSFAGCGGEDGPSQHTVTVSSGGNGSLAPGERQSVMDGEGLQFTATPNLAYEVDVWSLDNVTVQNGGETYTLQNITGNHAVNVTFRLRGRGLRDPTALSRAVVSGLTRRTDKIAALFTWVKDAIVYEASAYYVKDVEKTATETLTDGTGDCADKATLLAALLARMGEESYFIHIECMPQRPMNHRVLGIQTTESERREMSQLTGGRGAWKTTNYQGLALDLMDTVGGAGAYIGWVSDDYTSSSGATSWQWRYPTRVWPASRGRILSTDGSVRGPIGSAGE